MMVVKIFDGNLNIVIYDKFLKLMKFGDPNKFYQLCGDWWDGVVHNLVIRSYDYENRSPFQPNGVKMICIAMGWGGCVHFPYVPSQFVSSEK